MRCEKAGKGQRPRGQLCWYYMHAIKDQCEMQAGALQRKSLDCSATG
jgi:hypothetical protein